MTKKPIVLAFANNKGGTGKTTVALNVAAGLARIGKDVLMIDLDSQANLSIWAGFRNVKKHVGHLLMDDMEWQEVLLEGKIENEYGSVRLDLLPSARTMLRAEAVINANAILMFALRNALNEHGHSYDYIIVDCPPSLGALTVNALVAADYYIVPMQGENFAYIGLDEMLIAVSKLRRDAGAQVQLLGVLKNKFSQHTVFGREISEALEKKNINVFKTQIRQNTSLMECTALSQSIFDYKPKSNGAIDFSALVEEIIHNVEKNQSQSPTLIQQ
ncbi:ParA family protein [Spirosoma agri]|uniref:ParA family protein n=2 Tax=Spirosoma agri TaxID=1987381 RepID=A0A6M0IQN9_9BACT|nr:ParA family protein [Spirosoma agri]